MRLIIIKLFNQMEQKNHMTTSYRPSIEQFRPYLKTSAKGNYPALYCYDKDNNYDPQPNDEVENIEPKNSNVFVEKASM